jgi:neutral ceramidase
MAMSSKRTRWVILVLIVTGVFSSGRGFGQEPPTSLRAGAYAQDITPTKWPISVNGGMTDNLATAAHDPLHARCLVLKNDETSLAIVVCDSCAIPRELMDQAKALAATKTGIPESNILISATHSHSCPTATPVFQSEPDQEYVDLLVERIALGIEQAYNQLEPARIGWGSVEQRSLLFNRRWYVKGDDNANTVVENPFGTKSDRVITNPGYNNPNVSKSINLIDPELGFISVQSRDGRPIALLANYSLHYIGGVPAGLVSADYFGEFAIRLTKKLDAGNVQPPFVGIMCNGTSGDVNNVDFRQKSAPEREPFEQINFVAELLSRDVAKACEKIEYVNTAPLKVRQAEIVVGVRTPVEEEVIAAQKKIAEISDQPIKDLRSIYARETTLLANYSTSVKIKLQAMRIGTAAIAACPCETFTETGLNLKRASPFKRMFTISLANGYNGYLPPPEQYLLGGYETWRARSSYLSADSEPKIQMTLKRLLREVSQ